MLISVNIDIVNMSILIDVNIDIDGNNDVNINLQTPRANAIIFIDKLPKLLSMISGNGYDEVIVWRFQSRYFEL